MKKFLATFLFALTYAAPVHAEVDYSALLMQMAPCTADEQCVPVLKPCDDWIAINKSNNTAFGLLRNQLSSGMKCDSPPSEPPLGAQCVNNFCAIKE